jgi:hypothetical protein
MVMVMVMIQMKFDQWEETGEKGEWKRGYDINLDSG